MPRRTQHSREEIRAMAVQAAAAIINEKGLQQLSVRKIASAIGYAVGSLYLVFDNLDDLILQVNTRTLEDLYEYVVTKAEAENDPKARIHALAQAYLQFARDNRLRWGAVFEHTPENYSYPSWHQERVIRLFQLIEEPLRKLMHRSDAGAAEQAARALWSGVHGVCILAFTGKLDIVRAASVDTLLTLLVDTYLAGLEVQKSIHV